MNLHICDYNAWEDVTAVPVNFNTAGAIVQTTICKICGKRKLRKTNSISASDPGSVYVKLKTFLGK